jgi:hypothetical protein
MDCVLWRWRDLGYRGSTRKEGVKLGKEDLGDAVGPDSEGRKEGLVQNKANFRQAEVNVNLFA